MAATSSARMSIDLSRLADRPLLPSRNPRIIALGVVEFEYFYITNSIYIIEEVSGKVVLGSL